jgi:hypothetical protein
VVNGSETLPEGGFGEGSAVADDAAHGQGVSRTPLGAVW